MARTGLQRSNFNTRTSNEIAAMVGKISGITRVHKFGTSSAIGTNLTPVAQGNVYQTPTVPVQIKAVSDAATDTAAGTGAQQIAVQGLDANWDEQTVFIEMNGLTDSATTTETFIRVYRAWVSRSGVYATVAVPSQDGIINILAADDTLYMVISVEPKVVTTVDYGVGQSECAAFTIPRKKQGVLLGYDIWINSGKVVDVLFTARMDANIVTPPYSGCMRVASRLVGLINDVSVHPVYPIAYYPPMTDMAVLAKGASSPAVACDFQLVLIDTP